MAEILSINISLEKGTEKESVQSIKVLENWGLEGDAHADETSRQISIFPIEAIKKVPADKMDEVLNGGYTENITISGIPLEKLNIGTVVKLGDEVEVEIYHIGKDQFKEKGRPYIVSREGRFGKVIKGGSIKIGDTVKV
ncbi:sulfurase [Anaerovorax odorimutans]|uniref:sulfurase n=1 Tax=Anaerovorax odorimutans TaxID=109327 RepID=UPI00040DA539|nr:sulfurase [Anaerovorax odorimutans]